MRRTLHKGDQVACKLPLSSRPEKFCVALCKTVTIRASTASSGHNQVDTIHLLESMKEHGAIMFDLDVGSH